MDHLVGFLAGFIIAGMIGRLSSEVLKRWTTNAENTERSSEILFGEVGLRIVALILLLLTFFGTIVLVIFILQYDWLLAFIAGVFVAALTGFQLQNIRKLWKDILAIVKKAISEVSGEEIKKPFTAIGVREPISSPKNSQRVDHLKKLITEKSRRLHKLREQEAFYGKSTDPHISMEIEDIEAELEDLRGELANLKGKES